MVILPLRTPQYQYLEKGFKEWLDILGHCEQTVYNLPHIAREFFHYLETKSVFDIKQVKAQHMQGYYDYICMRGNRRRGGGLSEKYTQMHMQAITKLLEFLHHRGIKTVNGTGIRLKNPQRKEIVPLTTEEIKLLFAATFKTPLTGRQNPLLHEAAQARDRAMLTVYYSCGLRRTEGISLRTDDIDFDRRLIHVRKGKNYKERFVPFGKASAQCLQSYIYDYRPALLNRTISSRLFIAYGGRMITSNSMNTRLKALQAISGDTALQEKEVALHLLRHSIATHLLQAGMQLEKIARFLGHSTLDSTQIYTHLI